MKRILSLLLAALMLLSAAGCSKGVPDSEGSAESVQSQLTVQTAEPSVLVNKMTETELARVEKHGLTLLDAPEEPEAEPEQTAHLVSIEFQTITTDKLRERLAEERGALLSEEEYEEALAYVKSFEDKGETEIPLNPYILVDGMLVTDVIPYIDEDYDGGEVAFSQSTENPETGETERKDYSFESYDAYIEWLGQYYTELGYSKEMTEKITDAVKTACDALKTGNYETLPAGTVDPSDSSLFGLYIPEEKADYRDVWEYDRAEVEAIKDSVDEISIYDEELDTEFLVHVTRPPHYDPEKTYPVFFLTDAVWRFGNVPSLYKCMENGEAADVLLVTLGFGYQYDGTDLWFRGNMLVVERYQLLAFITNNLMPYLCENYNIDCDNSTIYGHSDGGVFTHTALCKSDLYQNQPFGHYIIGSPAFWGLYSDTPGQHPEDYEADYGYFDRNQTVKKSVFLCAGAQEDPDYQDSYNGHPTTLEGTANLKDRLEAHGTDLTYRLYDSHHWQYIPDMLTEYLKTTYPPEN